MNAKSRDLLDEGRVRSWYSINEPRYRRLAEAASGIIEGLLTRERIQFLSVTPRVKGCDSLLKKLYDKTYDDPAKDIHDVAGIRVIAFTESEATRANAIIQEAFHVHPAKTPDKVGSLGVNKIGYRSIHIICDLGGQRLNLPEFSDLTALVFEVQVRTVLQHAWAEFEHDRNYKFAGVLPEQLRRRLFLAAGLLEIADQEFDRLAKEIDEYAAAVSKAAKRGRLDAELNSTSIVQYLEAQGGALSDLASSPADRLTRVTEELRNFGLLSLADIDRLLTPEVTGYFLEQFGAESGRVTGLFRLAMLSADPEGYFERSWGGWQRLPAKAVEFLAKRHGSEKIHALLRKYDIAEY